MGLFGRRKRAEETPSVVVDRPDEVFDEGDDFELSERADGPYDEQDAPDDDLGRLDLGSVRVPVPDGAQIQVEMAPGGPVQSVNILTPVGQLTVHAYAAPRSGGLWRDVAKELAESLRGDGATVRPATGEWGHELIASRDGIQLRFVGVDGPRWMLRGVVAAPPELADSGIEALRELVRGTVVVRGTQPMPVGMPLQIDLPQAIAEHIAAAQAQQQQG